MNKKIIYIAFLTTIISKNIITGEHGVDIAGKRYHILLKSHTSEQLYIETAKKMRSIGIEAREFSIMKDGIPLPLDHTNIARFKINNASGIVSFTKNAPEFTYQHWSELAPETENITNYFSDLHANVDTGVNQVD